MISTGIEASAWLLAILHRAVLYDAGGLMTTAELDAFLNNIVPEGDCWRWTGPTWDTYGRFRLGGKNVGAHVVSYRHFKGDTNGLFVCHTCDNRRCVNPEHLFLGTCRDNWDDMLAKGRQAKGEQQREAKLTEEQVVEIRMLRSQGIPAMTLALQYGIHYATAAKIVNGQLWKHVSGEADLSISTHAKGSGIHTAKLAEEQIPAIRLLHSQGVPKSEIGKQFGVQAQTIGNIIRGKRWRHVP